ncbi:MAG: ABC transporter permease, partial [Desulfobacterales bacterium]|nr:ABC transporter permease [Desulfobacterales bacterium]
MAVEYFIAKKYLRAKRKEGFISLITFLSVAGVILGVMALVVVIAVMSGAETEFRNRILGLEPHMLVMNYGGAFEDKDALAERIRGIDGVTAVSPVLFGQAMIRTSRSFSGVMVRGVTPDTGAALIKDFSPEQLEHALAKGKKKGDLPGI